MSPDVSVVVPAYNGAAYVGQALASVFAQTLRPREVIVVDDASRDGTSAVVAACAKDAPVPVRLIHLRHNSGGPARPINAGVAAARGEFVAVLDQDDVFLPDKLKEQAEALAGRPDAAFVFSLAGALDPPGKVVQPAEVDQELREAGRADGDCLRIPGDRALQLFMQYGTYVVGFPGFLFRRRDWARKGGCDESFRICVDFDFLCWLCTRGDVLFLPHVQYLRRDHGENLSKQRQATYLENARIKVRHLTRRRWLRQQPAPYGIDREELDCMGYWLRQAGHHLDALRAYLLKGLVWGVDAATMVAVAKLFVHGVLYQCRLGFLGRA